MWAASYRESAFAGLRIFLVIAQVIDCDKGSGKEPNLSAEQEGGAMKLARLNKAAPDHGDPAEEEEHEEIAEASVGEGNRATCVAITKIQRR